jgi:hypothetical protein
MKRWLRFKLVRSVVYSIHTMRVPPVAQESVILRGTSNDRNHTNTSTKRNVTTRIRWPTKRRRDITRKTECPPEVTSPQNHPPKLPEPAWRRPLGGWVTFSGPDEDKSLDGYLGQVLDCCPKQV